MLRYVQGSAGSASFPAAADEEQEEESTTEQEKQSSTEQEESSTEQAEQSSTDLQAVLHVVSLLEHCCQDSSTHRGGLSADLTFDWHLCYDFMALDSLGSCHGLQIWWACSALPCI